MFLRTSPYHIPVMKTFIGSSARVVALGFLAALLPRVALAQIPPSIQPGQIQRQLAPLPPSTGPAPNVPVPVPGQGPSVAPGNNEVTFTITSVDIEGSTVYSQAQLRPLYAPLLGHPIHLADLYALASRITAMYQKDGYLLSEAVVPEQTIENGQARIQVIEGYVQSVNFTGVSPRLQHTLQGYAHHIEASRPLNNSVLERYLLLMSDLSGLHLNVALNPGTVPGASVLDASVNLKPFSPFIEFDNRGSQQVGPLRLQAGVYLNSLLGEGERFNIDFATTPEDVSQLQYGDAGLVFPIGSNGLTVNVDGSYTAVRPGGTFQTFDLNGSSTVINMGVSYPLIRSRAENLNVSIGFQYNDSKNLTLFTGTPVYISADRLRVLSLGVDYNRTDRFGLTTADATLAEGLGILGATTNGTSARPLSVANGSAQFTKFSFQATRLQTLPDHFSLFLLANGQVTGDTLLTEEQFGVGGATCGSAFVSFQIAGDSGYCVRTELARSFTYRFQHQNMFTQPYIFADYGQTFLNSPTAAQSSSSRLASAGLGVRQNFGQYVNLQVEMAFPLQDTGTGFTQDPRLFFTLQSLF